MLTPLSKFSRNNRGKRVERSVAPSCVSYSRIPAGSPNPTIVSHKKRRRSRKSQRERDRRWRRERVPMTRLSPPYFPRHHVPRISCTSVYIFLTNFFSFPNPCGFSSRFLYPRRVSFAHCRAASSRQYPKNWIFLVWGKKKGAKKARIRYTRARVVHAADKIHAPRERKEDGEENGREDRELEKREKPRICVYARCVCVCVWIIYVAGEQEAFFSEKKKKRKERERKSENLTGAGAQEEERICIGRVVAVFYFTLGACGNNEGLSRSIFSSIVQSLTIVYEICKGMHIRTISVLFNSFIFILYSLAPSCTQVRHVNY